MKILYIFRSLAVWGGIERILVDKMNWLASEGGIDVFMLTSDQGEHPIPYRLDERVYFEDLNINFHRQYHYSLLNRILIVRQMHQRFKLLLSNAIHRIQPDIIVCTTSDHINIITRLKGKIPLIVESHSICNRTIEYGKNEFFRFFHRHFFLKSLLKVDCVVSLTEGDAVDWRQFHPQVKVIPNMLHPCDIENSSLTSKRVIWVGRFDCQKRAEVAIIIWDIVVQKHPDWCLDIYGEGEMASEIGLMASKSKNVYVHKPVAQIFDCYCQSSILMSTSLFEPFGLVLVEAMSCGLPVVSYDCPYGPSAIIKDGVDGFLVPFDNIQYYVDKICMLMDNYSLRKRMGLAACASSKRFDAEYIMPQWKALFDELSKKR